MKCYLRPESFSVLSFDLDDTLYDNRPIIHRACEQLYQHLASRFEAALQWQNEDWLACKRIVIRAEPVLAHDTTACRRAVLFRALSSWGYQGNQLTRAINEAMDCFLYYRSDFRVDEKVLALLSELAKNYRLIAITNGNVNINAIGLADAFEFALHPGQGIKMKPATDMFDLATKRLDVHPAQIAHVGDSWTSDVQGSRNAGCKSIWLNPAVGQLPAPRGVGMLPHWELTELEELTQFNVKYL